MNKQELKKEYEENLKWIDDYKKVEKTIEDLQRKIKSLEELKEEIVESNTNNVINSFGHYDKLPYFYINLRDYAEDFDPKIYLNTKSVFNKKSSYVYFKEKLEEYVGEKLTLIEVVTPIFRKTFDRDGEEEIYTTVHHLLLADKKIEELEKVLKYPRMNEYKEFLTGEGVFVVEDDFKCSMFNEKPSLKKLNDLEVHYFLQLNDYRNKQKSFLLHPITQKYDKKLDDILLDVFDYTVKLEKLKVIASEKEATEKRIKEQRQLEEKAKKLQKEMDDIISLV